MKHLKYFLLIFVYILNLRADIVTDQLTNKTYKIGWYMFQATTNGITRTYLANNRDSKEVNGIRVWNFTNKRKWRPISNAKAFDGFVGTSKNFKSISISDDARHITFGPKNISKNIPLDIYLSDLANRTFEIKWYYWITAHGFPFLLFNRDSVSGISIYQHTAQGKWKPVHNAIAFDGYPKAKSIFTQVNMSDDGREVSIQYNKFNIPTIKGILPRETITEEFSVSSNSFSDDSYKNNITYNLTSKSSFRLAKYTRQMHIH